MKYSYALLQMRYFVTFIEWCNMLFIQIWTYFVPFIDSELIMQSLELNKLKRLLMAARSLYFDQYIAAII